MIDRIARDQLAFAIRRLGSGRMSFDEFCEAAIDVERRCNAADTLTRQVAGWWYGSVMIGLEDLLSTDFGAFRDAYRMTPSGRRFVARHWLLLKSDCADWTRLDAERKPIHQMPRLSPLGRLAEIDLCGARRTRYRQLRRLHRKGALRRIAPWTSEHEFLAFRARRIFFTGSTGSSLVCH
jgi:hypothetical protein